MFLVRLALGAEELPASVTKLLSQHFSEVRQMFIAIFCSSFRSFCKQFYFNFVIVSELSVHVG